MKGWRAAAGVGGVGGVYLQASRGVIVNWPACWSQCELPLKSLLKEDEHNSQLTPAGDAPRGI